MSTTKSPAKASSTVQDGTGDLHSGTGLVQGGTSQVSALPRESFSRWLMWSCVLIAVILRVVEYVNNRSFWYDEVALVQNIIHRSYPLLMQPLDHEQGAPLLFLWIEKFVISRFGISEYAFRLFPFACALLSVPMFVTLARRFLKSWQLAFAVALFAFDDVLIRYSSEVKQYGPDVALGLGITLAALKYSESRSLGWLLAVTGIGAVAIGCSFPAVLVAGAVAIAMAVSLPKNSWRNLGHFVFATSAWVASFAALYLCQLRNLAPLRVQLELYPGDAYVPHTILEIMQWAPRMMDQFSRRTLGLALPASYLIAVGIYLFARQRKLQSSDKYDDCLQRDIFVLAFPLVPMLILSCMHLYPMMGRFQLFLAPMSFICIARSLSLISNRFILRVIVAIAILFYPISCQAKFLIHPRCLEDVRGAVQYLRAHRQNGDAIFVFNRSADAFQYYSRLYSWDWSNVIVGDTTEISDPNWNEQILKSSRGKSRVWILASHRLVGLDPAPWYSSMIHWFDSSGRLIQKQEFVDAEVREYDLSHQEPHI